jgi:hypothetical protein
MATFLCCSLPTVSTAPPALLARGLLTRGQERVISAKPDAQRPALATWLDGPLRPPIHGIGKQEAEGSERAG